MDAVKEEYTSGCYGNTFKCLDQEELQMKPEMKTEISDSYNEDDPLQVLSNEVRMPVLKEELKHESSQCAKTIKQEEECLTDSNNEVSTDAFKEERTSDCDDNTFIYLDDAVLKEKQDVTGISSASSSSNPPECNLSSMCKTDVNTRRPFMCSICNKYFARHGHLTVHHRSHTNERPYSCSICNRSFTQRGDLGRHLRTHTNERPFTCTICSKSYTHFQHLTVHQRTHTNERPHVCSICHKSFTYSGDLSQHMRIHTNERPFVCNICNKTFTRSGSLSAHLRIHTNERPYTCSVCNKSFLEKGHLKKHLLSHTNEKPYSCNICSKSYTRRGHVRAHMRVHTK